MSAEDRADGPRSSLIDQMEVLPYLRRGLGIASPDALKRVMEAYWLVIADFHGFVEDVEGIDGRPHYLTGLKLRLMERLCEIDHLVAGREPVDRIHHLALAFEIGTMSLCRFSGDAALELVGTRSETIHGEVRRLGEFGRAMTEELVGTAIAGFDAQAERFILRLLQRWSVIAQARNEDLEFLADLLKVP